MATRFGVERLEEVDTFLRHAFLEKALPQNKPSLMPPSGQEKIGQCVGRRSEMAWESSKRCLFG